MVAQTRSKTKIGGNVNPVPETSHKKTMKKARSKVNVADASQKATSKEVVNHNVAEASKKEKKIKEKVEVAEDVDSEADSETDSDADTYPQDYSEDSDSDSVSDGCSVMKSVDYAYYIFLKDYMEKFSLVRPLSLEQNKVANQCYMALSRKERKSYIQKYWRLEEENHKKLEAERKQMFGEHYQKPRIRTLTFEDIFDYI